MVAIATMILSRASNRGPRGVDAGYWLSGVFLPHPGGGKEAGPVTRPKAAMVCSGDL